MEIKDISDEGKGFQLQHKRISVRRDDYYNRVDDFQDPFSQTALQHFMVQYLEEKNDDGLVGLVRYKEEEHSVIIDAAVRYLQ